MSTLIVILPLQASGTAPGFSYVLSGDGLSADTHGTAAATLLPAPAGAGAEVVAVVPVRALSWHQVELPKGMTAGSPRLRAALEGLLEDRLLDEPDALHFAMQPRARAGEPVWVAACDRTWLRTAVQALEAAGRPAARIVPELSPGDVPELHVIGESDHPELVLADANGVAAWPLVAASLPALPAELPVLAEPGVAGQAEQALQRNVTLLQTSQRWLRAAQSPWDLAQFDLASSARARAFKKLSGSWAELLRAPQWRAARWGAALLVLANLAGLNAWAWKERSALNDKRNAIRSALTSTFPNVRVVVDAPVQMEREVAALRQATGSASGRDFEAMLGAVASAAPATAVPTGLEFTAGELRVKGLTLNPADAQTLNAGLRARGYAARSEGDALVLRQEATP